MEKQRLFVTDRNPKIAHLTEEQLNALIDEYYEGTNLKTLLDKYNIDTTPARLFKSFPQLILEDKFCKYCNTSLFKKLDPRGSSNYSFGQNISYCPICGHKDSTNCYCKNCRALFENKRIQENKDIRERINQFFDLGPLTPINKDDLTIKEIIYLSTLVRMGLTEDKKIVKIYHFSDFPIAPSMEMFEEIIFHLLSKKIIVIHPDSPNDAFEDLADLKNTRINISKAFYHINIFDFSSNETLQFFLQPKVDISTCESELLEIWRLLAIEECKEYLKFSLSYVDFPYIVSEKTELIINSLLKNFSVAQIFGLIGRSLGYTTKEFQGGKLSRNVAGAYLMGAVQGQGERALIKEWNLTKYNRPKELPQSQLSKLFFETVLGIGEKGFNEKIDLDEQ